MAAGAVADEFRAFENFDARIWIGAEIYISGNAVDEIAVITPGEPKLLLIIGVSPQPEKKITGLSVTYYRDIRAIRCSVAVGECSAILGNGYQLTASQVTINSEYPNRCSQF